MSPKGGNKHPAKILPGDHTRSASPLGLASRLQTCVTHYLLRANLCHSPWCAQRKDHVQSLH